MGARVSDLSKLSNAGCGRGRHLLDSSCFMAKRVTGGRRRACRGQELLQWPWAGLTVLVNRCNQRVCLVAFAKGRPFSALATSTVEDVSGHQPCPKGEMRWHKYFMNPHLWWDNRAAKKSSTDPDFQHRTTGEALWVESQWTPTWVRPKLAKVWLNGWSLAPGLAAFRAETDVGAQFPSSSASLKSPRDAKEFRRLCEEGFLGQALEKLEDLDVKSFGDPISLYSSIIKECCKRRALVEGKRLFELILSSDYASSVTLGNCMIEMFVKCASLNDARKVFDRLPRREVSSWNTLLLGYVDNELGEEALEFFEEMLENGLPPNRHTFVGVLRACIGLSAVTEGTLVHALILDAGLEADAAVGKALVHMYLKLGNWRSAHEVFGKLSQRDVVTYNAMIQGCMQASHSEDAFVLLGQMVQEGLDPDGVTFTNMLKGCANLAALERGKLVHALIMRSGVQVDKLVGTTLVDMYSKCREMEDAFEVFSNLPTLDVVAWNSLIAGYVRNGDATRPLSLFEKMRQEGINPNRITYLSVLKAFNCSKHLKEAKEIHADVVRNGLDTDVALGSSVVDMFVRCGSMRDARQVFQNLPERNVAAWNSLICGYSQAGLAEEALILIKEMLAAGQKWDKVAFGVTLNACSTLEALEYGRLVHHLVRTESDCEADSFVGSTLVDMYMSCGSVANACHVFERLLVRDVVSWGTMLAGYVEFGNSETALRAFEEMQQEGVNPDLVTFVSVIKACATLADLKQGKRVHLLAIKRGYQNDTILGNSLIDMYSKCGCLETARELFTELPDKSLVSWNAMLTGYAQHGQGVEALNLFREMQHEQVIPDSVTFVAVLSACSHAGLVDEGLQYFKSMTEDYDLAPSMQHYAGIVDLLSRAGRLDVAEATVGAMPFEPDAVIWLTLLGACRKYCNVEVGRRAFEHVMRLEPGNAAAYMLLVQLLSEQNRWAEVAEIKRRMRDAGVEKKQPGCSWIEANNEMHTFVCDDICHPDRKQIYAALERIRKMVRIKRYDIALFTVLEDDANSTGTSTMTTSTQQAGFKTNTNHMIVPKSTRRQTSYI